MALESLKDIFEKAGGSGGGVTPSNPTPPEEQSPNINPLEKLYKPDSKLASTITFGNPVTTDYKLGTGVFNNPDVYDDSKIKQRTFDPSTLGKNQELGLGAYTLETLYNIDHTPVVNRPVIDTGRKDYKGNAIYINTGRDGMGSFKYMDIKASGRGFRQGGPLGFGDGREPYIVNEIGSKTNSIGNNRDILPFQAALEDVSRLAKFYTSTAGLAFIAKENITNQLIGSVPSNDIKPRPLSIQVGGDLNAINKILLPPIPNPIQGNTGFLNFTNQFRELGSTIASLRKPFQVEYSKRHTLGLPFGFLGDNVPKSFFDGERTIENPAIPLFGVKKLKFLGLGNGPRYQNNDKISDSGVVAEDDTGLEDLFPDETAFHGGNPPLEAGNSITPKTTQKGDFYVRIRDLRDGKYIYFRGYVTGITENVNPSFTPTNYIGRSEPVYLYERGERDLSFNLRVYPANIIQQDKMYEKLERLTSLAYPEYLQDNDDSAVTRMKAPFTELYMAHIGNRVKGQFGFIKSLSYTVPGEGDWDALSALPRLFDIAISYQILSKRPPSLRNGSLNTNKFYGGGA